MIKLKWCISIFLLLFLGSSLANNRILEAEKEYCLSLNDSKKISKHVIKAWKKHHRYGISIIQDRENFILARTDRIKDSDFGKNIFVTYIAKEKKTLIRVETKLRKSRTVLWKKFSGDQFFNLFNSYYERWVNKTCT